LNRAAVRLIVARRLELLARGISPYALEIRAPPRSSREVPVSEASLEQLTLKKDWQLDARAFHRLLAYLDAGENSERQNYVRKRERLVAYFDQKNCFAPDDLAEETLNRVACKLEEEGDIQSETAAKYCYSVARYVFYEHLRRSELSALAVAELSRESEPSDTKHESDIKKRMLDCLEKCTRKLDYLSHKIISRYYVGKEWRKIESRRTLAAELEISMNALSIRVRDVSRLSGCGP
jgi:DNA-directed RNA polymerase specialized sigma24 family protein